MQSIGEIPRHRVDAPSYGWCAITDVGLVRARNEDAFALSGDGCALAVADGVGGHAFGDVAATISVEVAMRSLTANWSRADGPSRAHAALAHAVQEAHRSVAGAAAMRDRTKPMGATLLVGIIESGWLHTCHVGDVRAYVLRGGDLAPVTDDHSFVARLVREGALTAEQAREHPRLHEIFHAVGVSTPAQADTHSHSLRGVETVLICSDGLWGAVNSDTLAEVLGRRVSAEARARELVARANSAGGRDNITAIVRDVAGAGSSRPRN